MREYEGPGGLDENQGIFPLQIPKQFLDLRSLRSHSVSGDQGTEMNILTYFCWLYLFLFSFLSSLYFHLHFLLSGLTGYVGKAGKRVRQSTKAMVINIYRHICVGFCCFFVSRELTFNQGAHASLQLVGIWWEPAGTPMLAHSPPPSALKQLFPPLPPPPSPPPLPPLPLRLLFGIPIKALGQYIHYQELNLESKYVLFCHE